MNVQQDDEVDQAMCVVMLYSVLAHHLACSGWKAHAWLRLPRGDVSQQWEHTSEVGWGYPGPQWDAIVTCHSWVHQSSCNCDARNIDHHLRKQHSVLPSKGQHQLDISPCISLEGS